MPSSYKGWRQDGGKSVDTPWGPPKWLEHMETRPDSFSIGESGEKVNNVR